MLQMEMGGAERLVYNLARHLNRDLFAPSVAWFFGERILPEFKSLDVPLYHVPKTKRVDISTMRTIGNIVRQNNIQLINSHHFMSFVYSLFGSKIKNRAHLVYTEHSEWEIQQLSGKWNRIGSVLMNGVDAAVGVSAAVTKKIQEAFNAEGRQIVTIKNGIPAAAMIADERKKTLRSELGLSPGDIVVGTVANFRKNKNHLFLFRAFSELIKRYANLRLMLIGQGFERDLENSEPEIRAFLQDRNLGERVLMLGYRSDVPELLNIIDIFCLPSKKEGLPISLIEAMNVGLPVVGTDAEGIREVIVHNRNGFLVPVGDRDRLTIALSSLIEDESLRMRFGRESRALATGVYSLDACVKQYENLFLSVLNRTEYRFEKVHAHECP